MTNSPAVSNVDLFADDVLVDPYPTYKALRDIAAVVHLPANDVYALTRYSAIRAALGDSATFSSVKAIGFNPGVNEALQGTSLASDPPVHTQLRATLAANLTPKKLRSIEEQISGKAEALVRKLAAGGSFEAIDGLARALPLEIVADLIGFTGQVKANMLRWGQAAMEVIGPMNQRTSENFPIAGELTAGVTKLRPMIWPKAQSAAAYLTPKRAAKFLPDRPVTSSTNILEGASTRRSHRSEISSRYSADTKTSSSSCEKIPPWFGRPSTRCSVITRLYTLGGDASLAQWRLTERRYRKGHTLRSFSGLETAMSATRGSRRVRRDARSHGPPVFRLWSPWLRRARTCAFGRSCGHCSSRQACTLV